MDVCSPHADCDSCVSDFNNSCVWCAGACQVSPANKDDGKWCEYGYADETTPDVCKFEGAQEKTSLPIDCRSAKNSDDPRCKATGTVGTGPLFPTGLGYLGGGFIDTAKNRLVLGAYYNNSNTDFRHGAVVAVDLTTGNRTLISATYVDGQQSDVAVGSGADLSGVVDVKPSPDGKTLYAATGYAGNKAVGIFTVDPTTGARDVIYDQTTTKCMFAGVNWALIDVVGAPGTGIAVGPDGTLYVATADSANGNGIATFKPSTKTCAILSMGSQMTAYKKGTGPIPYNVYDGLNLVGNTLYAEAMDEVHAIDITTGNRTLVSAPRSSPAVGTGPDFSDGYLTVENATTLIASGPSTINGHEFHTYTEVDIASGNRTAHDKFGPPLSGTLHDLHWFIPHPTLPGILIVVGPASVLLYEPSTGASMLLSN